MNAVSFSGKRTGRQRGDLAVYIALLMLGVMVSSALLLGSMVARQLRATEDAVASERAFYSANSGLEQALYHLSLFTNPDVATFTGQLEYATESAAAAYEVVAKYDADGSTPCVAVSGGYPVRAGQSYPDDAPSAAVRRLELGPADCFP